MRLPPLVGAALLVVAFAACGQAGPPPTSTPPPGSSSANPSPVGAASPADAGASSADPSASASGATHASPATTSVPSSAPAVAASPSACAMPTGAAPTALDPGLLLLLPASVGGAPVTLEPDSFAQAVEDSCFVASIDRAAFFVVVAGGDLASGVVAHVRPGVFSDRMFGDWRLSYDEGACAQSGGAIAHAEQDLAARATYVTTCGGGLRVYHTHISSEGVLISLLSVGSGGLGSQLIEAVRG